ncbi:hypothetical protein [Streptomyces brasiliscabiei]|uniref:hypothetical protein n=1 Tax=Streptomyces brasiliscabiei TaxID=2736302 RepID=UPI00301530E5
MIHTSFSVATGELPGGDRPSEDRIFQTPGAVVVLDGVSTVSDDEPRGGWYAETLGGHLIAGLADDPGADLRYVLERAISAVVSGHGLIPGFSPAATVAMVRQRGEQVDALVLADSPVIVFTVHNGIDAVRDNRLAKLVAGRPECEEYKSRLRAGRGFTAPEHRALLQKLRDHQLRHLNVPGGYWVAEADPEAAHQALVCSWPTADVAEILVMTDGVSAAVEDYGLYPTWDHLARASRTDGPDKAVRAIHALETREDPAGRRFPRYKVADDKALAHLRPAGHAIGP